MIQSGSKTPAVTSTVNSTTVALSASATFTGEWENIQQPDIMVTVKTDQNGTLYVDFSPDGVNADSTLSFNYDTERINPPHVLVKGARYTRVRFENTSASAQTFIRLRTDYGSFNKLTAPINGTLAENYDAIVTRPTDYRYEVALGKRQGNTTWNKWGYNPDVDTGSEEVIARFGGTFNIMTTPDTLDIVSTSSADTVSGAGATSVQITGIGEDFLSQSEIVNLSGTTAVTTVNTYLGVNRVITFGQNVGTITVDDTSGTVGVQAEVPDGDGVTQQAIFHTQINHVFLADWLWFNIRKSSGGTAPRVTLRGWSYSRVTDTTYEIFRYDIDTSTENTVQLNPSQPFPIGGREVLYFTAETNSDNTTVNCRFSGIESRLT